MLRTPDERYIKTQGSLIEMFWSKILFSFRREYIYSHRCHSRSEESTFTLTDVILDQKRVHLLSQMSFSIRREYIYSHRCHSRSEESILTLTDVILDQKRVHLLFWLRKTSVIVEMFQLRFHMFVCAFCPEISSFFQ